jgi:sn-glycerol 3-phosphate transport system permease protein
MTTDRLRRVGSHTTLILIALFSVIPIAWMYVVALRPADQALSQSLLPTSFSLENLRRAMDLVPLGDLLLNTTLMAAGVTIGQLLTSLLAAYAFGCWSFRGDRLLFVAFVASWLIPFQVIMVPNYVLLSNLGLLNSLAGVIVPQLTAAFAVLLLRQHMRSFPRELLEAARMDGLGSWATLWRVVVPSMRAPLSALAILLFVTAWNEYLWPRVVLQQGTAVVQTGLQGFLSDAGNEYGALMAAAGVVTLPVLVLYVLLQRQVVDAFMRSGLR